MQMYGSMFGLLTHADMLTDSPFPPIDSIDARFDMFLDRVESGDTVAQSLVDEAVLHIGVTLANQINANDPGNLLVTLLNERFLAMIEQPVRRVVDEYTIPAILACTNLRFFIAAKDWRLTGTAALALEQTYLQSPKGR
jgi:predicted NBD/HSP70 family sugar kinase